MQDSPPPPAPGDDLPPRRLSVAAREQVADGIWRFVLTARNGEALDWPGAGAHLPVFTPGGHWRQYSLCQAPGEAGGYEIAVKREAGGRGGSVSLCDGAEPGSALWCGQPRNHFALDERAQSLLLIAGGIGLTPILAMARAAAANDTPFTLLALSRDAAGMPFQDALDGLRASGKVVVHHDRGRADDAFDLWPLLEKPRRGTQVYCCGPRGLMDAVRDMSGHWPSGSVHFESFGVSAVERARDEAFMAVLASTGRRVEVAAGQSLLDALRAAGCSVASSCESGSCGSCRTGLLEGAAEHRDFVLGEAEQQTQIMPCVSRARAGTVLVLDL